VRVEIGHRFAVPLRDGYDYITDLEKWPEYWPGLIGVAPESRWSASGDQARVVVRLLGRPVELEMTLRRIEPYRLIEYGSVQRGLPDARHERHFVEENGGFAYRIVIEFDPRPGLRGLFDRLIVRRAVERTARQTIANLEAGELRR
jgi:polyketide cyclase/dehydrase/lipid transport protein